MNARLPASPRNKSRRVEAPNRLLDVECHPGPFGIFEVEYFPVGIESGLGLVLLCHLPVDGKFPVRFLFASERLYAMPRL